LARAELGVGALPCFHFTPTPTARSALLNSPSLSGKPLRMKTTQERRVGSHGLHDPQSLMRRVGSHGLHDPQSLMRRVGSHGLHDPQSLMRRVGSHGLHDPQSLMRRVGSHGLHDPQSLMRRVGAHGLHDARFVKSCRPGDLTRRSGYFLGNMNCGPVSRRRKSALDSEHGPSLTFSQECPPASNLTIDI
jgi:hypothetical protein